MKLQKYLDIEINRKIIRFFLENPSSIDTSRGIATWINENADKTEAALHNLARAKILVSHATALTLAYACTTDKKTISKIKLHLAQNYKTPK
jgi:hypothetical protein